MGLRAPSLSRHRPRTAARAGTWVVAAALAWAPPIAGQAEGSDRPRIGLVLSGGGARGLAHVGVLEALEQLRIPIHAVVANGMGALVGGVYCYGYAPKELNRIAAALDWAHLRSDEPRRSEKDFRRKEDDRNFLIDWAVGFRDWGFVLPRGVVQGHYSGNTLKLLTPEAYRIRHFDELPVRFRAVATAIGTGEEVVLSSGSLPVAMAASMAIPGVFAPVEIDGVDLVDGAVVSDLPIDVAKDLGVDVIIAVDAGSPLRTEDEIKSLFDVSAQMVSILMQKGTDEQLALLTDRDILIRPELGEFSTTDFDRVGEAMALGKATVESMAGRLRRLSVSEEEYAAFLQRQRRGPTVYPVIDEIVIVNDSHLSNEVIAGYMVTTPGRPLDPAVLRRDLDRIYGREDFERVTFELERREDGGTVLRILAVAKEWGPNYIRFGLNIEDTFHADGAYNFRVNYTMRTLNSLGAELRNDFQIGEILGVRSEFYQPLDDAGRFFVSPAVEIVKFPADAFQDEQRIADIDVTLASIGFDAGVNLGNWAQLRVGPARWWGEFDVDLASVPARGTKFDDGGLRATLQVDTLDDPNFPSSGTSATAAYLWALSSLGADEEYQALVVEANQAFGWRDNSLVLTASYGTAIGSTLPFYRLQGLGGFLNLSGFEPGELGGQNALFARLMVFRRISGRRFEAFGMPVYLGGSFEVGDVTDDRNDLFDDPILAGSAWAGVDSPIGPVYFGYGMAEGGRDSLYLFVGATFAPMR